MQKETDVHPRKAPRQQRSRATVEALLLATAKVLAEQGYDRATTNRIATVAGVSVGSLYQYYPNKEALLVALVDRHHDEIRALFAEKLVDVVEKPLEDAIRALIGAIIDCHRHDPYDVPLHQVMFEQIPRIGLPPSVLDFERFAVDTVRAYLELRREEIRPTDLDMTAFIIVHAVQAVVLRTITDRSELLEDPTFVDEVAQLVLGYLV